MSVKCKQLAEPIATHHMHIGSDSMETCVNFERFGNPVSRAEKLQRILPDYLDGN